MVFYPPAWVPKLPIDPPDSIPVSEFILNEQYGRVPIAESRNPYTCGVTGETRGAKEVKERVELLAAGLADVLGWKVNEGSEWDKVVGVWSANTVSLGFLLSYLEKVADG
jgi:hypothetical protein